MNYLKKDMRSYVLLLSVSALMFVLVGCGGGGGGGGSSSGDSSGGGGSGGGTAVVTIPNPPDDNSEYFQILIHNRISSSHTVHLAVTAADMSLTSPTRGSETWLTGGGSGHNDWTQPVFHVVDSATGSSDGTSFASTYAIAMDNLPLDTSGQYRILKIPFRKPGDSSRSLAGSGHVTITLDKAPTMNVVLAGTGSYSIAMPSPDWDGAGGQDRWDFMEFNCATPAQNGKPVCFVNTTNVDFFSLGVNIKGRSSTGTVTTIGPDLSIANPITTIINALKSLTGEYAAGLVNSQTTGDFLRFRAPSLSFSNSSTAWYTTINNAYVHYATTPLEFYADSQHFYAVAVGNILRFTQPSSFDITMPTTKNVLAATGSLQTTNSAADIASGLDTAKKYIAAYISRGVFQNTSLWNSASSFYPTGSSASWNEYSYTLHEYFLNSSVYGFSFDDVGNFYTPKISDCTSMTLTISNN